MRTFILCIGVAFSIGVPAAQNSYTKSPDNAKHQGRDSNAQSAGDVMVAINEIAEFPEESDNQSKEKAGFDRRIADYTENLADYTRWLAIVTAALALFSGWQIWFLRRADKTARISADAAKQSADVAKETLVATNRPWLLLWIVSFPGIPERKDGMIYITSDMRVKNVGNSPAINIKTFVRPIFELGDRHIADIVAEECGDVAEYWRMWGKGEALFHGDIEFGSYSQRGGTTMPDNFDIVESDLWVLVGVSYVVPFQPTEIRYTVNLYKVTKGSGILGPIETSKLQTYAS